MNHYCNNLDDGGWSEFGEWSECFCGGPVQIRARTCTNPTPDPGGADCQGPSSETQDCYTEDYPKDCSGKIEELMSLNGGSYTI